MKKIAIALIIILILLFLKVISVKLIATQQTNQTKQASVTEIIEYKQTYIPEEKRIGSCWNPSIAASLNENAYRCSSEQQIFDPCFKEESGRVVCGVDPEQPGSGFELQLTKKLPEYTRPTKSSNWLPWRLKLEGGRRCGLYTGTAAIKEGKIYYINCEKDNDNNSVYGELNKSENLWKINLIHENNNRDVIFTKTVDIIKVWK